jgi:Cys-Gly metallodipeptidase DUG1
VIGKFSIRIVPNMKIATVEELVKKHVEKVMAQRKSPNKAVAQLAHGGDYWFADYNNDQYQAARRATVAVHGIEPDMTREGGSIPITCTSTILMSPLSCY